MKFTHRPALVCLAALALSAGLARTSTAELFINEIFFDPPAESDDKREYIELRGSPGMSLNNHYLLFLENEDNSAGTGNPGQIELIFDLNGRSLSPTGYFSLRQKDNPYTSVPDDEFNIQNKMSGVGWGTTPGVDNDIGAWSSALYSGNPGLIENSGFTAMIVKLNGASAAPTLGFNLDGDFDNDDNPNTPHDGLDYLVINPEQDWKIVNPGANIDWTIVDSIGVFSEGSAPGQDIGEAFRGRTYAKINFGPEIPGVTYFFNENGVPNTPDGEVFEPNITADQTYVGLGYELELVARWGDSTGQTAADWHITNVTDSTQSNYTSPNYRQSGHFHDTGPFTPPAMKDDFVQTNQFVPYGAVLTNTIGAANYPLNLSQLPWDYDRNGTVDALDYVIWRLTYGSTTDLSADGNGGRFIEDDDYAFWAGRYGLSVGGFGSGGGANAVPEPATLCTAMLAGLGLLCSRRARR